MVAIIPPAPIDEIIDSKFKMLQVFMLWTQAVSARLTDREVITGTGSPEAVVEANVTQIYMDDAGTAGNIVYIKRDADIAGDPTKGWILV